MQLVNLVGQRFGRLTASDRGPNRGTQTRWFCQCDCGNTCLVQANNLRSGNTTSCGCWRRETLEAFGCHEGTHNESRTRLYITWMGMKQRCLETTNKDYPQYGGRGITIYTPWRYSYVIFRDWILEHLGDKPRGMSLDRIDVNGDYAPGNLRWANAKQQANNRSNNRSKDLQCQTQ